MKIVFRNSSDKYVKIRSHFGSRSRDGPRSNVSTPTYPQTDSSRSPTMSGQTLLGMFLHRGDKRMPQTRVRLYCNLFDVQIEWLGH